MRLYFYREQIGWYHLFCIWSKKGTTKCTVFFTNSILWKLFDLYGLEIFHLEKPTQTNKPNHKFSWHFHIPRERSNKWHKPFCKRVRIDCHNKFSKVTLSLSSNYELKKLTQELTKYLFLIDINIFGILSLRDVFEHKICITNLKNAHDQKTLITELIPLHNQYFINFNFWNFILSSTLTSFTPLRQLTETTKTFSFGRWNVRIRMVAGNLGNCYLCIGICITTPSMDKIYIDTMYFSGKQRLKWKISSSI